MELKSALRCSAPCWMQGRIVCVGFASAQNFVFFTFRRGEVQDLFNIVWCRHARTHLCEFRGSLFSDESGLFPSFSWHKLFADLPLWSGPPCPISPA